MGSLDLTHWYVFPVAVLVATTCNASGFSGAVLFQPFFLFELRLPLEQSIATEVATETIGMTSGASRHLLMRQVDGAAVRALFPPVAAGVLAGLFVFSYAPRDCQRLIVGLVVGGVALHQLFLAWAAFSRPCSPSACSASGRFTR